MNSTRSAYDSHSEIPRIKIRYPIEIGPSVQSKPITVKVGKHAEEFFIHQKLVESSSDFFKKALNNDWKEGQQRTVNLPEVDVGSFRIYAKWLYSGRFYLTKEGDVFSADDRSHKSLEFGRWANCYELGEFYSDDDFKDAAIDAMIETLVLGKVETPLALGEYIYPHSTPGSTHRKFAVDVAVHLWTDAKLDNLEWLLDSDIPHEYSNDLVVAMAKNLRTGLQWQKATYYFEFKNPCEYHDHTRLGKPCYKTKDRFEF